MFYRHFFQVSDPQYVGADGFAPIFHAPRRI
jgi:hypothetical protein